MMRGCASAGDMLRHSFFASLRLCVKTGAREVKSMFSRKAAKTQSLTTSR